MVLTKVEGRKMILRFAPELEESKYHLARNFARAFGFYFSVMKRLVLVTALLAVFLPTVGFAQGQRTVDFRRERFAGLSRDWQTRLRTGHVKARRCETLGVT